MISVCEMYIRVVQSLRASGVVGDVARNAKSESEGWKKNAGDLQAMRRPVSVTVIGVR